LKGDITTLKGENVNADEAHNPVAMDVYYIVSDKCTECVGFHDEPQCAAVCPVDCCIDDENHRESKEDLMAKKSFMHI
jgi:hypothetical protein